MEGSLAGLQTATFSPGAHSPSLCKQGRRSKLSATSLVSFLIKGANPISFLIKGTNPIVKAPPP